MEPVIQQFRSALGGFNRRDVQQYIESSSAAHRKEVAELQARLEAALRRQRELEAALSDLEGARSAAAAEEAKVREHLETSTQTLTRLRGEQTETESRLAVARSRYTAVPSPGADSTRMPWPSMSHTRLHRYSPMPVERLSARPLKPV